MISKYNEFLFESMIYNLILEGKMVFSEEFVEILDNLSTSGDSEIENLSSLIRDYIDKEVSVDSNCIDLSDKQGMISFVPDAKLKEEELIYKIKTSVDVLQYEDTSLTIFDELNIPSEGLINNHPRSLVSNKWKIIKKEKLPEYNQLTFYYLQDFDDPSKFILVYYRSSASALIPVGSTSNRKSDVKLGKFINKFLAAIGKTFPPTVIEKFVKKYQLEVVLMKTSLDPINFKVVEGEEIRKWYNENIYENNKGQLGTSCMKYDRCQDYFDIYVENPEVCKLLIFTSNDGKLAGRALLWTLENGRKYMDRIYTNKDSYDNLFLKWGKQNGYEKSINTNSIVNVKAKDYELYPYMDTFKFYKFDEGKLSNSHNAFKTPYFVLESTDGSPDL